MVESGEGSVASMEMVEEGQSQVKISRKLKKFQKVVDKGEEDRISALPDCLLLEILSRLPSTKKAIRTGTLSKRWKHIWTLLHILIFSNHHKSKRSAFVSFVDKTLTQCRQVKLKKLILDTYSDLKFQSQLRSWIRYAICCNVEQLEISFRSAKFLLDQFFFLSSCFTDLTLKGCILKPSGAISWKNLRNLRISSWSLDEDLIENILSGSPLLETLVLEDCCGYRQLNITSKSLKKLVLSRYPNVKREEGCNIIKINAPYILSLAIHDDLELRKLLLLNVSSLVEADLDYILEDIDFKRMPKEVQDENLKGLILNLRHVKELKIGEFCSNVVYRLKAKGFIFPSNIIKFPNEAWSDSDSVESEDS